MTTPENFQISDGIGVRTVSFSRRNAPERRNKFSNYRSRLFAVSLVTTWFSWMVLMRRKVEIVIYLFWCSTKFRFIVLWVRRHDFIRKAMKKTPFQLKKTYRHIDSLVLFIIGFIFHLFRCCRRFIRVTSIAFLFSSIVMRTGTALIKGLDRLKQFILIQTRPLSCHFPLMLTFTCTDTCQPANYFPHRKYNGIRMATDFRVQYTPCSCSISIENVPS